MVKHDYLLIWKHAFIEPLKATTLNSNVIELQNYFLMKYSNDNELKMKL